MATCLPKFLSCSASPVELERDDHADLAETGRHQVVHVARDGAVLRGEIGGAPERHVLADGADHLLDGIGYAGAAARKFGLGQFVEIALGRERRFGNPGRHGLEGVVPRDEVRLGVDLNQRGLFGVGGEADQAFGGDPAGFLGGLREPLGPQPIDRGLHVAVGLVESRLAIHHARAGLVAQVLHHGGSDRHALPLSSLAPGPRSCGSPTRC